MTAVAGAGCVLTAQFLPWSTSGRFTYYFSTGGASSRSGSVGRIDGRPDLWTLSTPVAVLVAVCAVVSVAVWVGVRRGAGRWALALRILGLVALVPLGISLGAWIHPFNPVPGAPGFVGQLGHRFAHAGSGPKLGVLGGGLLTAALWLPITLGG